MSTLTTSILNALAENGIEAAEVETIKNGITCRGFQIDTGTNVRPVVYYSPEETAEAFVEKVLQITSQPAPEIDANDLVNKERLLNDTILCVQKQSNENLVKKEWLNLELYVRVMVDFPGKGNHGSIKISPQILNQAGLTAEELFNAARKNSIAKATIGTMAEALGAPEELFTEIPFFVGTYDNKCHGAGILALDEVLHSFCESRGYRRVWLLPSSTEEVLILPTENADPAELSAMVHDVNTSDGVVDPMIQLENCVYQYDDETQEVSIASSYVRGC